MVDRTRNKSTWSPSMHECLKKAEAAEEVKCIQELNEDEREKLLSNTCGAGEDEVDEDWRTPLRETGSLCSGCGADVSIASS